MNGARLEPGQSDLPQNITMNGGTPAQITSSSGITHRVIQFADQSDPTLETLGDTQSKKDPDEKSLADLNGGGMPRMFERKIHLIRGTSEKFNESMRDNLGYLDGLIKSDNESSDLKSLSKSINELRQEIQSNPKMSRREICRKYENLKSEAVKLHNKICHDGVLKELNLDKNNFPKGKKEKINKVCEKALNSKKPVNYEKLKADVQGAIKSYNESVADRVEKGLRGSGFIRRALSPADRNVLSEARQDNTKFVDEGELRGKLNAGVGGLADDNDNINELLDAAVFDPVPENDEFNANNNPLLNDVKGENGDPFFGGDEGGDMQPETLAGEGTPEVGTTKEVANPDGGKVETNDDGEKVPDPEDEGVPEGGAPEVDTKKEQVKGTGDKSGVDVVGDPVNTGEGSEKVNDENAIEDPDAPFVRNFEDEDGVTNGKIENFDMSSEGDENILNMPAAVRNDENVPAAQNEEKNLDNKGLENSFEAVGTNKSVEKQKGQKQEEFIQKTLEKFNDKTLKKALGKKLNKLNETYYRAAFYTRSKWVISRAKKLQAKFEELDQLKNAGKISEDECNECKNELANLLKDTKSGLTHSKEFNTRMKNTFANAERKANTRNLEAIWGIVRVAKKNNDYSSLVNKQLLASDEKSLFDHMLRHKELSMSAHDVEKFNFNHGSDIKKIAIEDSDIKNSLDDRLDYISSRYCSNEEEFTARVQRMIDRARKIESAINEINGGNSTPTTQDPLAQGVEEKKISYKDKQSFLDLLNIKTGERFEARFDARLNSLKAKIAREKALQDEIAEKAAKKNAGNNYVQPGDWGDPIENPIYNETNPNEVIEDPFINDFEESWGDTI